MRRSDARETRQDPRRRIAGRAIGLQLRSWSRDRVRATSSMPAPPTAPWRNPEPETRCLSASPSWAPTMQVTAPRDARLKPLACAVSRAPRDAVDDGGLGHLPNVSDPRRRYLTAFDEPLGVPKVAY